MNDNFRNPELNGSSRDMILLSNIYWALSICNINRSPCHEWCDRPENTKMNKSWCPCPTSLQCELVIEIKIFCGIVEEVNTSDLRKLSGKSLKSGLWKIWKKWLGQRMDIPGYRNMNEERKADLFWESQETYLRSLNSINMVLWWVQGKGKLDSLNQENYVLVLQSGVRRYRPCPQEI